MFDHGWEFSGITKGLQSMCYENDYKNTTPGPVNHFRAWQGNRGKADASGRAMSDITLELVPGI